MTYARKCRFWCFGLVLCLPINWCFERASWARNSESDKKDTVQPEVPKDMRFEPSWRGRGDCGPIALYILMRLAGRTKSLDEVQQILPVDSDVGCSLASIARAADSLDFATEIRFVNPQDLPRLPFPFILHSTGSLQRGIGHFTVVVGHSPENKTYSTIDTTFHGFKKITEEALLTGFTGYVLVPKTGVNGISQYAVSGSLILVGSILAIAAARPPWFYRAGRNRSVVAGRGHSS